jgi:tRNA pseudouridine38-40 synthase
VRYFIEFAYNGTHYLGWQSQPDTPKTVQETLEKNLSMVLRTPIKLTGAGRTDSGVHARCQFAHFDFGEHIDSERLAYNVNAVLPADIAVRRFIAVHESAHARFDAKRRTYEYHIHTQKDPFLQDLSFLYMHKLDLDRMNEAASLLFNHADFESFSKVKTDVKTFICRIFEAHWKRDGERLVFTVSADRFLRNMVRALTGTLIDVGLGKIPPDDFTRIIESKDRRRAGFSVPAHGLYLTKIEYDYISLPTK